MKSKYFLFLSVLLLPIIYLFMSATVVEARCDDERPADPILLSAIPGEKSVTLTWSEPSSNLTYYILRYGLSREEMQWGNANIGGPGTTTFTVNELENNVKYYFQVGAGNGCRPGGFSNTMGVTAGIKNEYVKTPNLALHKEVTPSIEVTPDLALHKDVLGTTSTYEIKKEDHEVKPLPAAVTKQDNCAFTCNSWPLLVGEIVALLVFFFLAHKYHVVRPIFSVLIPIITVLLYYQYHGMCYSYKFLCRYFMPLTITIYLLILVLEKFSLLFRHTQAKKLSVR